MLDQREALYGGAAGGGKSSALLMAAAQYVDTPGYAALLLRQSFPDLMQPDALIPRSKSWWHNKADWNAQTRRWTFPSGATVSFGYLERDDDVYQYQGAAYQFIGIDELTQHSEFRYRYLFSRLRKPDGMSAPLRMRASANPGGKGHEWVKQRFITGHDPDRAFVPARLSDNPTLGYDDYVASLQYLDPLTRAQLLAGDWDAYAGGRFKREWFLHRWDKYGTGYRMGLPPGERYADLVDTWLFITVDPAASLSSSADYTVISVWGVTPRNDLLWLDCVRVRLEIPDIVPAIQTTWNKWQCLDSRNQRMLKFVGIESVASNCAVYQAAKRTPMVVRPLSPAGKEKLVRATPAMNLAATGRIWLPRAAHWLEDVEAELFRFTGDDKVDAHDDVVDTLSYAAELLTVGHNAGTTAARPAFIPSR